MKYSIQHIAALLKGARLQKQLSQRALSLKTGIPQGHISKIENGEVDMQVSSLIELSRILDLELMLVPRRLVASFDALQQGVQEGKQQPMYRPEIEDNEEEI